MAIHECRVAVRAELGADLEDFLNENEESGWMLIEDPVAGLAVLKGFFESKDEATRAWSGLADRVKPFLKPGDPVFSELADQDWRLSYREHFKAWHSGPIHWVPVWERESYAVPPGDVAVWLDPGMAFGTGNHETTRLCLNRLIAFDRSRWAGSAVIDAGCGSGILAISAARLGFGRVRGFDLDPEAVVIARKNADLNGLADRLVFSEGDLESGLAGVPADVVLANILSDVLVRFADRLIQSVLPGGVLVLSGILSSELPEVRAAFRELAPNAPIESATLGEWADLLIRL
ncbi:MAG: 50S ribosomal protein L11 methyltransferase [Opitutaceae bacterium]